VLWNATGAGNPIVPGYFADPSIYAINGVCHLYCTTDGYGWDSPAPTVWTSRDLMRWSNAPLPLSPAPNVFWAPSLARKNGKYYLYYAKGQAGSFGAVGRPVTASSSLSGFPAGYACDGNNGPRWAAANNSVPQWIRVDLGATYDIGRCETTMEYVRKKVTYRIEYSTDGSAWSLYVDRTGGGGSMGSPLIDIRSGAGRATSR
jgi:hypothetical protein